MCSKQLLKTVIFKSDDVANLSLNSIYLWEITERLHLFDGDHVIKTYTYDNNYLIGESLLIQKKIWFNWLDNNFLWISI